MTHEQIEADIRKFEAAMDELDREAERQHPGMTDKESVQVAQMIVVVAGVLALLLVVVLGH